MQMLLIRHALPERSAPGEGSDPALSARGREQADRLPSALTRFGVTRVVSSPQRRALQTARPAADALGLPIEVDSRFAEYDTDADAYITVEELAAKHPEILARLADGHLPSGVDVDAFKTRVSDGIADVLRGADDDDTIAVFSHGGVINVVLHQLLFTPKLFNFAVDYTSITRVVQGRKAQRLGIYGVNSIEHVWDLLSPQGYQ